MMWQYRDTIRKLQLRPDNIPSPYEGDELPATMQKEDAIQHPAQNATPNGNGIDNAD